MAVVLRKGDPCYGEALARGDVLVALDVPVKRAAREAGVPVALLENRVKRSESCPGPRVLAYREAETVYAFRGARLTPSENPGCVPGRASEVGNR